MISLSIYRFLQLFLKRDFRGVMKGFSYRKKGRIGQTRLESTKEGMKGLSFTPV